MRIGIITFHASLNCGSMLQAFALQNVLAEKYGAEVEIINYSNWGQRNYYANWDWFLRPAVLRSNIKALFHYDAIEKMRTDYLEFENQYLNLTPKLMKHKHELNGIDKNYDIVVAGGDQVWRSDVEMQMTLIFCHLIRMQKKWPILLVWAQEILIQSA